MTARPFDARNPADLYSPDARDGEPTDPPTERQRLAVSFMDAAAPIRSLTLEQGLLLADAALTFPVREPAGRKQ